MDDIKTKIAVTNGKGRRLLEVSATAEWLKDKNVRDEEEARAVVVERAYKLLELEKLTGGLKGEAASMHFNAGGLKGAGSIIPGMEPPVLGATSTYCCICNDANPPECACVPC